MHIYLLFIHTPAEREEDTSASDSNDRSSSNSNSGGRGYKRILPLKDMSPISPIRHVRAGVRNGVSPATNKMLKSSKSTNSNSNIVPKLNLNMITSTSTRSSTGVRGVAKKAVPTVRPAGTTIGGTKVTKGVGVRGSAASTVGAGMKSQTQKTVIAQKTLHTQKAQAGAISTKRQAQSVAVSRLEKEKETEREIKSEGKSIRGGVTKVAKETKDGNTSISPANANPNTSNSSVNTSSSSRSRSRSSSPSKNGASTVDVESYQLARKAAADRVLVRRAQVSRSLGSRG